MNLKNDMNSKDIHDFEECSRISNFSRDREFLKCPGLEKIMNFIKCSKIDKYSGFNKNHEFEDCSELKQ